MSNYRRSHVPGETCFFTVNLLNRHSWLLTMHIDALRQVVGVAKQCQGWMSAALSTTGRLCANPGKTLWWLLFVLASPMVEGASLLPSLRFVETRCHRCPRYACF